MCECVRLEIVDSENDGVSGVHLSKDRTFEVRRRDWIGQYFSTIFVSHPRQRRKFLTEVTECERTGVRPKLCLYRSHAGVKLDCLWNQHGTVHRKEIHPHLYPKRLARIGSKLVQQVTPNCRLCLARHDLTQPRPHDV